MTTPAAAREPIKTEKGYAFAWPGIVKTSNYVADDFLAQVRASIQEHIPPPDKDVNP